MPGSSHANGGRTGRVLNPGPGAHATSLHLLIPVDATLRSRWGLQYAIRKHREGEQIQVSLLHVAEPLLRAWDILRFRQEQDVAALRAEHGRYLLEWAAAPLWACDIASRLYFREGQLVFEILDAAEQLGCDQVVLPAPRRGWQRIFSGGVVRRVVGKQRGVQVVTVNERGEPERS